MFIRVCFICLLFCVCVCICVFCVFFLFWVVFLYSFFLQYFDTVGWVFWPVKNRRPYNLYCVGGGVKPYLINESTSVVAGYNSAVFSWTKLATVNNSKPTFSGRFCASFLCWLLMYNLSVYCLHAFMLKKFPNCFEYWIDFCGDSYITVVGQCSHSY